MGADASFDVLVIGSGASGLAAAVSARAASHPSFHAIDVWRDPRLVGGSDAVPPGEYCYCPHTRRRFREWLERKSQGEAAPG